MVWLQNNKIVMFDLVESKAICYLIGIEDRLVPNLDSNMKPFMDMNKNWARVTKLPLAG
jgi:hypothetical protein